VSEIPLLGKIPILGFFFRNKNETDDHTELLIFITPRILNRPATAVAAGQ
jgi:type IV pilus assembly protein PilQ